MTRFAALLTGAALLCAGHARAELIVFEDGRVVKASGYRLLPEELEVELPGGGSYRVALERVDRIVDDEVLVETVAVEGDLGIAQAGVRPVVPAGPQAPLRHELRRPHRRRGQEVQHRRVVRVGADSSRVEL